MVFQKGHLPWNATADKDDPRLKLIGYKKGNKPWNTNISKDDPRRENFVKNISLSRKGKPCSNGFKKGNKPWSNGLIKELDPRLNSVANKMSLRLSGVKPWNTNKTMQEDPRLLKISQFQKNKIVSEETSKKISLAKIKLFKDYPEKHPNRILAKNGGISKPQIAMFNILKEKFPDASLNHPVHTGLNSRHIDVALPTKMLAFEYNGSYWHKDNIEKDKIRTNQLNKLGWKVIDINEKTFDELPNIINNILENK